MSRDCFGKPELAARCTTCPECMECHDAAASRHSVFLLPIGRVPFRKAAPKAARFVKEGVKRGKTRTKARSRLK